MILTEKDVGWIILSFPTFISHLHTPMYLDFNGVFMGDCLRIGMPGNWRRGTKMPTKHCCNIMQTR
jgi:hypothetical protein